MPNNTSCLCTICNRPVTHVLERTHHVECQSFLNRLESAKSTIEKYNAIIAADMQRKKSLAGCKPFCRCSHNLKIAQKKIDRANEIADSMEFAIWLKKTHPVLQWPI